MTTDHLHADDAADITLRYEHAKTSFQHTSQVALHAEIAFVTQPTPQTELAYRQAHGGFTSAQVEFHEAQYARIMHASGAGQLAKFLAEQLDAKLQLLEEVSVENRDGLRHLSGLITTLIERLESPITGRRRLEGETD